MCEREPENIQREGEAGGPWWVPVEAVRCTQCCLAEAPFEQIPREASIFGEDWEAASHVYMHPTHLEAHGGLSAAGT